MSNIIMLKIFCFLISTALFIDINESLPAPMTPLIGTADTFQDQPYDPISTTNNVEPSKQSENGNKTDHISFEDSDTEPPVLKHDPQKVQEKSEAGKVTFEMFKRKCQHLQNLLWQNKTNGNSNRPAINQHHWRPRPISKPSYPTTSKPNGFYITAQTPNTRKAITHVQTPPPIKYIRLEPVILQKTILSDGRTVYYWHNSLPTAVEYPSKFSDQVQYAENAHSYGYVAQNINIPSSPSSPIVTGNNYYYPSIDQNQNIVEEDKKPVEVTTESTTTTTTTTEESYGYGFGSFLPFYSLTKEEPASSTTTQPTTTSPPMPSTDKGITDDLVYAQRLKFIVPVPYDGHRERLPVQVPWSFDPYAYYPKGLQPSAVDVRVPYTPTFHMIRAVALPKLDTNVNERIDQADSAEQIVFP